MPLIVPNASEVTLLQFALGYATPGNQTLKLFTNNITPSDTDVAASYTVMSGQGYADITLTKSSWSVTSSAGVGTAVYGQQTWTFTAGGPTIVYGYYIVDSTTGLLLWSELFNSPKTIANAGDQIQITPTITLSKV